MTGIKIRYRSGCGTGFYTNFMGMPSDVLKLVEDPAHLVDRDQDWK
jgi:hypothetical protein